jgi:hypothetical protein
VKTTFWIALGMHLGLGSLHAQWTVYDPAVQTQLVVNSATEVAKFVQMINNQVSQIRTLTDQLNEVRNYITLFGDPKQVALPTAAALVGELRLPEPGTSLTQLQTAASGVDALTYQGAGLFAAVGTEFVTPGGQRVPRNASDYLPQSVLQKATDNFLSVSDSTAARRRALKEQIARTAEGLKVAATDAEVQKLAGILTGLSAALVSTEAEFHQAAASALVQDVANRNDERRQKKADLERQRAEFSEAVSAYAHTFRLTADPVAFPTH